MAHYGALTGIEQHQKYIKITGFNFFAAVVTNKLRLYPPAPRRIRQNYSNAPPPQEHLLCTS
jgi:hypothetical protein